MARAIQELKSTLWASISGVSKFPFQWVFGCVYLRMPPHFEIVFQYLMHMHNYIIMKRQIDLIENEFTPMEDDV